MFGRGYAFLSVSVCTTDANGFPTSYCTPLTYNRESQRGNLGFPVNPGLYTAPATTTLLHPNTTYAVLVRARNLVVLPLTRSNANDAGASSGWSIGDSFDCFNCARGRPHTWVSHDEASLQIQILGTERSEPIVASVRSVAVNSTPALTSSGATSPDTYALGEPIYFTVTFNDRVAVTGDPEFEFSLGSSNNARRAAYDAGRSTPRKLVFVYTVQATDVDTDGIWVGNQNRTIKLDANDRILTSTGGAPASLAHNRLGTQSAHKVDGTRSPPAGVELDPPLTASLSGPPEHDGRTPFKVTLSFSEEVSMMYRTVREKLLTVSGAALTDVRRLSPPSNLRYELTVRPSGNGAVTLARGALPACGESDTICTADNRPLEGPPTLTVPETARLSVANATVEEGPDAALAFAVTLDRERHAAVTVDYATSDGSATAGQDYTAASGTLTFAAGETAKTVSVAVLDDTAVEGVETFTLSLSNATGARIVDGRAVGTIENPQSEMEARFLASWSGVPAEHDGRTPFNLTLTFSEEVSMSYKTVRDGLFTVRGGTIPKVRRLNPPSNLRYEVTVRPGGNDPVTLARAALPACGQSGALCTSDARARRRTLGDGAGAAGGIDRVVVRRSGRARRTNAVQAHVDLQRRGVHELQDGARRPVQGERGGDSEGSATESAVEPALQGDRTAKRQRRGDAGAGGAPGVRGEGLDLHAWRARARRRHLGDRAGAAGALGGGRAGGRGGERNGGLRGDFEPRVHRDRNGGL